MNNLIASDLYRINGLKGFYGLLKGLKNPGFKYLFILRKLSFCQKKSPAWFFYSFLKRRYSFKYGFQIPTKTKIGKGLYIGHFGTLIINESVTIGENCNLSPNVVIGETNRGKNKGNPTIGNNVWIGSGAVIVGKITIGSNVLIAPNSFVMEDIPNNSVVIGNPIKISPNEYATDAYINYTI